MSANEPKGKITIDYEFTLGISNGRFGLEGLWAVIYQRIFRLFLCVIGSH